jgi:hypothetical protein
VRGQRHALAALYPKKDPVPILQEAGWVPGPVWTGAENLTPTGIGSPNRPARSQSLYRLTYRAHVLQILCVTNLRCDKYVRVASGIGNRNECECENDFNFNLNQIYLTLKMEAECLSEISVLTCNSVRGQFSKSTFSTPRNGISLIILFHLHLGLSVSHLSLKREFIKRILTFKNLASYI